MTKDTSANYKNLVHNLTSLKGLYVNTQSQPK